MDKGHGDMTVYGYRYSGISGDGLLYSTEYKLLETYDGLRTG